MLVVRILALLLAVAGGASVLGYLFTQDRRYLRFALRIAQFATLAALIFFGLLILERILVPIF